MSGAPAASASHSTDQWGLQSNRTMNWTEHCAVLQRPQVPVILVFQSVCFSSKRQNVFPPFEIVVQGLLVPGAWATRQPAGIGTWQVWDGSPLAMPKLQACSVVAGNSEGICAPASDGGKFRHQRTSTAAQIKKMRVPCMFRCYHSVLACGHRGECVESAESKASNAHGQVRGKN